MGVANTDKGVHRTNVSTMRAPYPVPFATGIRVPHIMDIDARCINVCTWVPGLYYGDHWRLKFSSGMCYAGHP